MSISLVLSTPPPSNSRVTEEVGRNLRRGANMPRTKRKKSKVERQKLKIQGILDALEGSLPTDSLSTAMTSISESGVSSALPSPSCAEC